jgi:uncharacterized protein YndB with AHSA1/START domain
MNPQAAAAYVEPVVKTIRVQATPARAFEVFTTRMSRWWPPGYSISPTKTPLAEVVLEPRAGGRWYERGTDGSECDWGRVLVWEPPARIVLAWQITAAWQFDPTLLTEVEVRFEAHEPGTTEIKLEHRRLERMGETAAGMRAVIDSDTGWSGLLKRYTTEVATPPSSSATA